MRKTPPPILVLPFPPYAEPRGGEGAKKCRVTRGERGRGMRSGSQGSKPNYRAVEQSKGGGKRTRNNKRQKKLVPLVLATVHPLLNMILLLSPFFLPFHFLPSLPPPPWTKKEEKPSSAAGGRRKTEHRQQLVSHMSKYESGRGKGKGGKAEVCPSLPHGRQQNRQLLLRRGSGKEEGGRVTWLSLQ